MESAALYSDFGSLAGLRTQARQDAGGSLREVASQFESLFVQMMLKSMRDATMEGGLFDSNALESYEQMYDQQLAVELSRHGGIGLAEVIVEQLRNDKAGSAAAGDDSASTSLLPEAAAAPVSLEAYRARVLPSVVVAPTAPAGEASSATEAEPGSPAGFVEAFERPARRAAAELGVDASVLLAQAALETGWGRHVAADQRGSSHNLFNIKAGPGWDGPTVRVPTLEYRDGVAVRETAEFRAYASADEAFSDYVSLIGGSPRYEAALEHAADGPRYLQELQRAGYATDPAYADKILSILERGDIGGAEGALKNSPEPPLTI